MAEHFNKHKTRHIVTLFGAVLGGVTIAKAELIQVNYLSYGLLADGAMRVVLANGKITLLPGETYTVLDGQLYVESTELEKLRAGELPGTTTSDAYGFDGFGSDEILTGKASASQLGWWEKAADFVISPPILVSGGAVMVGVGAVALTDLFAFADDDETPVVDQGIRSQTTAEGEQFTFTIPSNAFTDDKTTLTYTASNLPQGLSFDSATRTFSGTPSKGETKVVAVTATDTVGQSVTTTFQIAVTNENDAPKLANGATDPYTLTSQNGFLINKGDSFEFDLNKIVEDEESDDLTFTTTTDLPTGYTLGLSGIFSGPVPSNLEDVRIDVAVTDSNVGSLNFDLILNIVDPLGG